jgi:uncharacterized membrane protein
MPLPDRERLDVISKALARLWHSQQELEARLQRIEASLGLAAKPATPPVEATPPPLPDVIPPPPAPVEAGPPPIEAAAPPPPLPEPALETQFGLNWLNRIAIVTLLFGVAFFFKLAADNQWIGPGMRVALGIAAATFSLFLGEWMSLRNQKVFAQGMTGLGLALLYLSFYATFGFYHLLPQSLAFFLMALTTLAAGGLALHYSSPAVAVLGLLGGYLTPVLLSTGEDHPWILFGYVFLLNLGGLTLVRSSLVRARRWLGLEYLCMAATFLLYAGWASQWLADDTRPVATVFAIMFYAQFAAGSISRSVWTASQFLAGSAPIIIWRDPAQALPLAVLFAAAGLAVAAWREWPEAPVTTLAAFWLPIWLAGYHPGSARGRVIVFLWCSPGFALFFLWTAWRTLIRGRAARPAELWLLAANAAAYFGKSYFLLDSVYHEYVGAFALGLAILHALLAKLVWKPGEQQDAWQGHLAAAIAVAFLTLAIPIQFNGFRITIAWALEGAALAWIGARFSNARLAATAVILFVIACARLFTLDAWIYSSANDYRLIANARFLTFAVSAASLWTAASAWSAVSLSRAARFTSAKKYAAAAYLAGHIVLLWVLVMEAMGWAERYAAPQDVSAVSTVAVSILMACYALALIAAGVATRTAINRLAGLALMLLVVAKLYLVDVWQLSRGFRITAFLGLGALLLLVSYLYSRFRPAIEKLFKDRPAE